MVKNVPAMWETWVGFLGREEPLEREWQPNPVFLPGKSHGQRSLAGYSSWDCKELDTTELLTQNNSKYATIILVLIKIILHPHTTNQSQIFIGMVEKAEMIKFSGL